MRGIQYKVGMKLKLSNRLVFLLTPFLLIAVSQAAARIVGPVAGAWAWAYLFTGYWLLLAILIGLGGGGQGIYRWLRPSQGGFIWPAIAICFSLATTLWITIPNWRLLFRPDLFILSIIFALINPCLEEGYWRGLLIDLTGGWPRWLAILYTGILFSINHLFVTVLVPAARNPAVWGYQLVVGILMAVVYVKTKSLRWPIISHAVINLLSLTIAMFMGLYIPRQPG